VNILNLCHVTAANRQQMLSFPLSSSLEMSWHNSMLDKLVQGLSYLAMRNVGSKEATFVVFFAIFGVSMMLASFFLWVGYSAVSERPILSWVAQVRGKLVG
jgi:hypothetical protein